MIKAIICDLDGTLALIGDRNPFNPTTVENDVLNKSVANVIEVYSHQKLFDVQIIFVTGRYEKYRQQTENWLQKHNFSNYLLFMRQNQDSRKDMVYKKEVYIKNIQGKFEVLFVLEDRDQMVRMWREELRLPCFQVEYGDF